MTDLDWDPDSYKQMQREMEKKIKRWQVYTWVIIIVGWTGIAAYIILRGISLPAIIAIIAAILLSLGKRKKL